MNETGWDVYLYFGFTATLVATLYGLAYYYYLGRGRNKSERAKFNMMDDEE